MHIYTSSFFKFRNKANFYSFLGASAGTGAPRNTQKIGTQCGCEYGYKNYESFGSLLGSMFGEYSRSCVPVSFNQCIFQQCIYSLFKFIH